MGIDHPSTRLTTQNLVVSAASALHVGSPKWSSIQNLAMLIDLFCMYDTVAVLGRPVDHAFQSSLGDLLYSSGFLRIERPSDDLPNRVSSAAKKHLLSYLGEEAGDGFDDLLRIALSPGEAFYGLGFDGWDDVERGDMWLKMSPGRADILGELRREADVARGTTFIVRSFVYLAYGDAAGLVFVPDVVRSRIVGPIAAAEQELRGKLLRSISEASSAQMLPKESQLQRMSPLAAVVLERAQEDRERIPSEMKILRSELAPLRERLRQAEEKVFFGIGPEVADAVNEWNAVCLELQRHFGDEPHLVSVDRILNFGQDLGGVVDETTKATTWMALLFGLPFDVARRLLTRRKAVELHRLRSELPASGRLRKAIIRLFGPDIA